IGTRGHRCQPTASNRRRECNDASLLAACERYNIALLNQEKVPLRDGKIAKARLIAAGSLVIMFGLFKTKITLDEYGHTATKWANKFLVSDAGVSLGILFDDFWDRDTSLTPEQYLEPHGIPASKTTLYIRLFAHCA